MAELEVDIDRPDPGARARVRVRVRDAGRQLADLLYPPRCMACGEETGSVHGLCGPCWRETAFVSGPVCDACGVPVPAPGPLDEAAQRRLRCGDCTARPPAWDRGRAAMLYEGAARRMVLALKHGDRLELVPPLAGLMAGSGRPVLAEADLLAPVPLHWTRLLRRRFNQAAELARAIAALTGRPCLPDLFRRIRATGSQETRSREARRAAVEGAFRVAPRHAARLAGARVLLVDDVMTTGATLSALAGAARAAGAAAVHVLVAARVTRPE